MNDKRVCLSDTRIENAFKEHLNITDTKKLKTLLERFYDSYYVRGKSLRAALIHTTLNNNVNKNLLTELEYFTTFY